jgi:hypothetical protein
MPVRYGFDLPGADNGTVAEQLWTGPAAGDRDKLRLDILDNAFPNWRALQGNLSDHNHLELLLLGADYLVRFVLKEEREAATASPPISAHAAQAHLDFMRVQAQLRPNAPLQEPEALLQSDEPLFEAIQAELKRERQEIARASSQKGAQGIAAMMKGIRVLQLSFDPRTWRLPHIQGSNPPLAIDATYAQCEEAFNGSKIQTASGQRDMAREQEIMAELRLWGEDSLRAILRNHPNARLAT